MRRYYIPLSLLTASMLLSSCAQHDVVTYSEFRKIKPNMTLSEVEEVVGAKGRIINGEDIDNAMIATKPGELVYFWENKDKSNMSVAFLNGHVINLSEYDLK